MRSTAYRAEKAIKKASGNKFPLVLCCIDTNRFALLRRAAMITSGSAQRFTPLFYRGSSLFSLREKRSCWDRFFKMFITQSILLNYGSRPSTLRKRIASTSAIESRWLAPFAIAQCARPRTALRRHKKKPPEASFLWLSAVLTPTGLPCSAGPRYKLSSGSVKRFTPL